MPRAELAAVRLEQLKLCEYSLRLTLPRSKGELTGCGVIVAIPYSTTQLYPVRVLRRWQLASVGRTASGVINRDQDLSGIRVGLHDEIFQGAMPVLVGVGAASTYSLDRGGTSRRRYPGRAHLLETTKQGLTPDCTIADAGQGLRAGQKAAWGDTPCHGDVFHLQRQCEGLAKGATSRRRKLQAKIAPAGRRGPDDELAGQLDVARQAQTQANWGWPVTSEHSLNGWAVTFWR